jgi:hypothetical protein
MDTGGSPDMSFLIARLLVPARVSTDNDPQGTTVMISRIGAEGAFDPEAVRAMMEAFESALAELGLVNRPEDPNVETLARTILELAKKGERDPIRLRELALASGIRASMREPAKRDLRFDSQAVSRQPHEQRDGCATSGGGLGGS